MIVSEVCAAFEVLCSVPDGHYIESGNCSVSDEEQVRCAYATHVSYLMRREQAHTTRVSYLRNACFPFT
jgi:hypothetical protein